jgi:hypothetical protein
MMGQAFFMSGGLPLAKKNKQDNNVGNLGDILKHAPLPDLIACLGKECDAICYVDPFAYKLNAPMSTKNENEWPKRALRTPNGHFSLNAIKRRAMNVVWSY